MAGPNYVLDKGFEAGDPVTKFTFVQLQADESVEPGTAGEEAIGVVQGTVEADQIERGQVIVDVRLLGISRCIVQTAGSVVAGDEVEVGTGGTVVAQSSGVAVGIALQSVTTAAAGHHVDVLLTPAGG
jgi:hypothetical protein